MIQMDATQRDRQWREEYRGRRYLEHATNEVLQARLLDLTKNAYFCHSDGLMYSKGDDTKWMCWLTHIFEESTLRAGRSVLRRPPGAHYRNARRAAELWDPLNIHKGTYFLKFGEAKYVRPMYEYGKFMISPASKYADPSLNDAIRDNYERRIETFSSGGTVGFIKGVEYKVPPEMRKPIPIIGPMKYTTEYDSNCYMACFGMRYEYRLFDDMSYDSCLVIRDPRRFIERVKMCSEDELPGWTGRASPVIYHDPFHPSCNNDVLFSKHFRFAYQKEYRIVWEPPDKQAALSAISLELGPLTEYCDLLIL
jgi:hypothetical protein